MQKYFNNVVSRSGAGSAVQNASVTVNVHGGSAATLYSDNGITPLSNPVFTDVNGYFEFYAADGRYDITISAANVAPYTISDIILEDPADDSEAHFDGGTIANVALTNVTIDGEPPLVPSDLVGYEPAITAGTTSQYWRGDKSFQTLDKTAVGLSNVENKSSSTIRGEITSGNVTTALGYTPLADTATTDSVTEGASNLYYTSARFTSAFSAKSTTDLSEGTNLYYTSARFNTAFSGKSTTDLSEGTNLYYTAARFSSAFGAKTTADLTENTNLYFTTARVLATALAGLSTSTNAVITSSDTVLSAAGKLQKQITDNGTSISGKEPSITAGTSSQYWRGDKTFQTLNTDAVTEGSTNLYFTTARVDNGTQDFRLTLTSGTPVTTSDVTGATTVYCTPYKGNRIALYTGSAWVIRTSAEFSLALGTLTSGKPYDVFCYDNSGTPTLEFLVWTDDTTRATALAYQDGVLVKSGATTRRYLGTFYTTATTTTEDSVSKRYLVNYYNRVAKGLYGVLTANRTTTSSTFVELNSEIRSNFLSIGDDATIANAAGGMTISNGSATAYVGIAFDGTTAEEGSVVMNGTSAVSMIGPAAAAVSKVLSAGKHYATVVGNISGGFTLTVTGTSTAGQRTALRVTIFG